MTTKRRREGSDAAAPSSPPPLPRAPWLTPARTISSGATNVAATAASSSSIVCARVSEADECESDDDDSELTTDANHTCSEKVPSSQLKQLQLPAAWLSRVQTTTAPAAAAAAAPLQRQSQPSAPWLNRAMKTHSLPTPVVAAPYSVSTPSLPLATANVDSDAVMPSDDDEEDDGSVDGEDSVEDDDADDDYVEDENDDNSDEDDDCSDEMKSLIATDSADDSQRRSALKGFHCTICDIKFAYRHSFAQHQALVHVSSQRPFECTECHLAFRTATQLQAHERTHIVEHGVVHRCERCSEEFDSEHKREMHRRSAHGFRCAVETCALSFTRKEHLTRHAARFHQVKLNGEYKCEPCSLQFDTRHEKELHRRAVSHRSFPCTVPGCTKRYSRRDHLTRHAATAHASDGQTKPFRCELCNIGFAYSHGLVRHRNRSHANQNKPYTCAQCLLAFKKKSDLQAHSFVHTGVLPFECETCGKRFAKRFQLGRHERLHAAHKQAQTQVLFCAEADCGEMFFGADDKAKHDREVHNKFTPSSVACDRTGMDDSSRGKNKKRKRGAVAAADTPPDAEVNRRQLLKCEVCGRTLQRKQNLRAHLRTHFEAVDERKMHVCPMDGCANAYTRKSNLMAHYNAVHDAVRSQRFVCPYDGCDGKFGYKKVLTTHIESVHVNPTPSKKPRQAPGRRAQSAKARVLGVPEGESAESAVIVVIDG